MKSSVDTAGLIFNLEGNPFPSFDAAVSMRDRLIEETGAAYRIERCANVPGFVVVRPDSQTDPRLRAEPLAEDKSVKAANNAIRAFKPTVLHQALRVNLLYVSVLVIAFVLFLFPESLELRVLEFSPSKEISNWINPRWLAAATQTVSGLITVWLVCTLAYRYFSSVYVIASDGIAMRQGLIARETLSVRYRDIRSVGLKQSVVDRLLNIGMLEFASAGTDDVDIRFSNIVNPTQLKARIQTLITTGTS